MRSKRRTKKTTTGHTPSLATLLRAAALSLLVIVPVSLLLLLLAAALLLKTADPNAATSVTSIAVLFAAAVLCGALATRFHHRQTPLLCGVVAGLLLLLCLCVASVLLPTAQAPHSLLVSLLLHASLLPLSILGAKLGGREKRHRKYH